MQIVGWGLYVGKQPSLELSVWLAAPYIEGFVLRAV